MMSLQNVRGALAGFPRQAAVAVVLLAIAGPPGVTPALAGDRVFRLLDQRDGLPAGEVVQLAQDSRGFIWMGSFAGLVRYDGEEFRRWAPERLNGHVSVLTTGPGGEVLVGVEPGRRGDAEPSMLYRVVPDGVEPVPGPDGTPLSGVADAAFGSEGLLCVTQAPDVACRRADGTWVRHVLEGTRRERARWIRRGPSATVLVATDAGLWQIDAGGARRIAPLPDITDVVPHPDGSLFATTFAGEDTGRIVRVVAGVVSLVATLKARPIDMAVRGNVVWASFDRFVVAVRPGEPPEILGPEAGLPSGGPLLVDHEGSLWLGTYSGVMHLPEPETVVWTERDGLVSAHTRFLEVVGDSIWVGTWQGLGRMRFVAGRWQPSTWSAPGADGMCLDADGHLWIVNPGAGFVRHARDRQVLHAEPRLLAWLGCGRRPDGTLWLTTSEGLFVTAGGARPPRRVAANPGDPEGEVYFRRILEDGRGRLWVAANEHICHAPAAMVLGGGPPPWRCGTIAGSRGVSSIVELNDGDLWLSTDRAGVWRYEEAQADWVQLAGSASLPSYSLRGLVPSGDGGVWILGHGTVARVRDDHAAPDGWTVIERLTGLQGLPSAAAERIAELPDGSLWITTIVGLVHVPAIARTSALAPPGVDLVDVVVNGRRIALGSGRWRLDSTDTLELRFAALSYRDRGLLQHEYRMHPDADWTSAPAGTAVFRFPDLAAGAYTVAVRASLDGRTWTARPASVSFEILPPWYRRDWALAVFTLSLAAALYVAYRLRLTFLLRLERQRTRIAMDLHDEIGSGLGSINILASLAAERTPPGSPQAGLVNEISDTAAELGASLGEIVWSLRSRSATLDALVSHLAERAVKLFPGDTPALGLAIPDTLPPVTLSLPVRWNVALVAIEALHNASRHAAAAHVVLGLEPAGRRWRLWVEDDGRGLDAGVARGSGLGIEGMKRRAGEIGGDLTMTRNVRGGLTVALTFDPRTPSTHA